MKKQGFLAACIAALVLAVPGYGVAGAANPVGEASVDITVASRLNKEADMDFGLLIPGTTGGTITVRPNGTQAATGTVTRAGGSFHPAGFSFERRIFRDYPQYAGPRATDSINLVNPAYPGSPMRLRNFTTDFSQFAYFFSTEYEFHVGGTLEVASDQPPGAYTGTFTVTLDNF